MENNANNATNTEDTSKNIKVLKSLLESGELAAFIKRVGDIRKQAEKLYAQQKAKLSDITAERVRKEEDESRLAAEREAEEQRAREAEAVEAAPLTEPEKPEAPEEKAEAAEKPPKAEPEKPAEQPAQQASVTRTAIPSYIRGVVKHTPKPPATERPRGERPPREPRPAGQRQTTPRPGVAPASRPAATVKFEPPAASRKQRGETKKSAANKPDDKRQMNKRTLIRKGYIQENVDEERMGTRKLKNKKVSKVVPFAPIKIENAVITTENLTVKILSETIGKTAQEIIKKLMELGIMTTINSVVDFPTMQLVADALGVNIELKLEKTKEEQLMELHSEPDPEGSLVKRPPIITVMGHVDHGKTSLLDAIRKTSVASGEAGGITQHIGAYSVSLKGEKITFLDTPGHEAFTAMRRRGATITDIAILIVAADDGVMPQTVEAIKHAKEAGVPIVVAINKVDKAGADPARIKQQLAEHDVLCEEWGGDVPMIPISAKQKTGIDELLENVLFRAEYLELRANPNREARGYVIEARLDKGRGPVANVIVRNGTLKVGDYIVSGITYGKVRSLTDDRGSNIKSAGPSTPVSVIGLSGVPNAGESIDVVESEKMAKEIVEERISRIREGMLSNTPSVDPEVAFANSTEASLKEFRVFVKADVQGSSEALKDALSRLSNEEVVVNVIGSGVGAINQSDVMNSDVAHATIIGFNVKPDGDARTAAERAGVPIKQFNVIYDAVDFVTERITQMLAPKFVERTTGKAIVRTTFKVSGVGIVAGSYVQTGKIVRGGKAKLYRGGKVIFEGNISGLKRFKDDAKEVTVGLECGIAIDGFTEFLEDDEIECIVVEKETK